MAKIKKLPAFPKPLFLNNIDIVSSQRKIPISHKSVKDVVFFLARHYEVQLEEITVHFVGKKKICALHKRFFEDPTPTDCITLPYENRENSLLGEIFICPEVAKEYTSKKEEDLYREITLYVIHGFLHLLGFIDTIPKEKKKMRQQEKKMLDLLKKNKLSVSANKS